MKFHSDAHQNGAMQCIFGHGDAPCDCIKGRFHRLKFGHDLLDPGEVFKMNTEHYGGALKGLVAWLGHLFADSFSAEGLPFPGLPRLRKLLDVENFPNYHEYRQLMTIKGRDLVGAALVELLIKTYFKLEGVITKIETPEQSTRVQAIRFFSHSFCAAGGLLIPAVTGPAATSVNYPSVLIAGRSLWNLAKLSRNDELAISSRQRALSVNDRLLERLNLEIEASHSEHLAAHENILASNRILILKNRRTLAAETKFIKRGQ